MALGTTNLTMTQVATALGAATTNIDLKALCTHASVNVWSRYKSGYLESDGSADNFIQYQAPQGGGTTDPRGTDSDVGHALETYKLGDFRGYNHSAAAPYVSWPTTVHTYPSGTGTATGLTRTFYAQEVEWDDAGVYRATNNWAGFSHVHLLDDDNADAFVGTAAIPALNGNVAISLNAITLTPGVTLTKNYHAAFGVDSTHWSVKLGTLDGAGGIGTVKVLELLPPAITDAIFSDTSFTGGANDPYTSAIVTGSNTNRFSGTTAIWDYSTLDAWRCYYSGGSDYYRNIAADWYIKGFVENPATEYFVKTANFASNGANNTVDLTTMSATPPRTYWADGDNITLVLKNLTINF